MVKSANIHMNKNRNWPTLLLGVIVNGVLMSVVVNVNILWSS